MNNYSELMLGILVGLATTTSLLSAIYFRPELLFACFSKCFPKLKLLTKISDHTRVILTIDDAPGPNFPWLLEILKKHSVTATFFIISSYVTPETHPLLVQAIREGHHLANHGRTNTIHACHDSKRLALEIEHCREMIRALYLEAEKPMPVRQYYRPGSGFPSQTIEDYLVENGFQMVLGSVYPHDPQLRIKKLNRWYLETNTGGGDIVIIHDLPDTPEVLDQFLPVLKGKNLTICSLEDYDRKCENDH